MSNDKRRAEHTSLCSECVDVIRRGSLVVGSDDKLRHAWHDDKRIIETRDGRLLVAVSGTTYNAALDPYATAAPREHGWPRPGQWRRYGKHGMRATYILTHEQARTMREHLQLFVDAMSGPGVDDYDGSIAAEVRAIRRDLRHFPRVDAQ